MKSKISSSLFCLLVCFLSTTYTHAQVKRNEKVGEERLNDNYGGDADTSTENFVLPTSNGKLQVMIDPLSIALNGRIYGELQYSIRQDMMLSFGFGYHGLNQNKVHSILEEVDPRKGQVFRLGISDHFTDYLYLRYDLMASTSNYLSYENNYDNFNNVTRNEFENKTFKMGAFIDLGIHLPLPSRFYIDVMYGIGFMAGKTKTNLKNVYKNVDYKEHPDLYPFGPGIGFYNLESACFQAGFRVGYELVE